MNKLCPFNASRPDAAYCNSACALAYGPSYSPFCRFVDAINEIPDIKATVEKIKKDIDAMKATRRP